MSLFDSLFAHLQQPVAQILLTRNDIADRTQYLNAQNTFAALFDMGVIPIVNENDTIAVTEIKFGDNDTLSAITAGMVQADYLFLMTDVDCLYDKNPRRFPDAVPIAVVDDISMLDADVSTAGSNLGTGGMSTKIVAARLAISAGVTTIITRSSLPGNIVKIVAHDQASRTTTPSASPTVPPPLYTRFLPSLKPIRDRSFWLLHGLAPHGTLYVDPGAAHALAGKAGLLPVGVVGVSGNFLQQEAVRLVVVPDGIPVPSTASPARSGAGDDAAGATAIPLVEIGRAVVNYSAAETARIQGLQSTEIRDVLGYADSEYIALRENISLFGEGDRGRRSRPVSRPATPGLLARERFGEQALAEEA
ncbi:MAG: hypothetical protein M1825_002111 [Sarcosagium campestre]|nr:MAG: hypothetical protein M1825_002111 [Sarcosagium campestre]